MNKKRGNTLVTTKKRVGIQLQQRDNRRLADTGQPVIDPGNMQT